MLITCHFTKTANDLLIRISFINENAVIVDGGVLDGAVEAQKVKNSWETAPDQGFASRSLLLNKGTLKTKDIVQSSRYDCIRDAADCWSDRTSQRGRPRSLTTICWSDLIRCDGDFIVSVGQILPGLVREKGDSYYEVAPLAVRERNRKPHDLLCCKSSSNERQTFSGCAKEGSRCVCQSDEV